jgi:hypothetical protein
LVAGSYSFLIIGIRSPGFRCLVSAQPLAKKKAGLIEKETEVSYDLHGIRLRAQGVYMQFNLILFVLVLVLVLVLEIRIL